MTSLTHYSSIFGMILAAYVFLGVFLNSTAGLVLIQNSSGLLRYPQSTRGEQLIYVGLSRINLPQDLAIDQAGKNDIQEITYSDPGIVIQSWKVPKYSRNYGEVINKYWQQLDSLKGARIEFPLDSTPQELCSTGTQDPHNIPEAWESMRICTFVICILPFIVLLPIYLYCHWIRDRGSYDREDYEDLP